MKFDIKRGHGALLEGDGLKNLMVEMFGDVKEENGAYVTSFGATTKFEVKFISKSELEVSTESDKNASEEDIQATLDFINWCVTSEEGTKMMCSADGMGFVIPFKNNLKSENPLVNIANDYMEKGYTPVDWTFSTMPSEQWKNDLGSALTTYAADQTDANWKLVQNAFVDGWAKEAAAATK